MFIPAISVVVVLENWMFYPNYENMTLTKLREKLSHRNTILETCVNVKFHVSWFL